MYLFFVSHLLKHPLIRLLGHQLVLEGPLQDALAQGVIPVYDAGEAALVGNRIGY
ncbi:MAG: hypothetical protein C5S45_01460 [Candidatus Methanocomedens sp.]|nr:MAG: hypothetical protein C5S45_01460 [ANME-2 cluster archaeon]